MLDELNYLLNCVMIKPWRLPQFDSFLNLFFTEYLCSSANLQSVFQLKRYSMIISLFLKKSSTRLERVNQLINTDKIFFLDEDVQRIALRSQQHRKLIDQLIEDDKCFTIDKLLNQQSKFPRNLYSELQNIKLPGLNMKVLSSCYHLLTGKQQQHITKIILNDYLHVIPFGK